MPTIDRIDSIKINVYSNEHRPPHIHATYNEFEVLLEIETLNIYAGFLPNIQFRLVLNWLHENREWAFTVFKELNPELL